MKKILLSVTSAFLIMSAAKAQVVIAPELGLNMANMKVHAEGRDANTDMKAGLEAGVSFDFGFSDNFSFQPGIYYMMTGTKENNPDVTVNVNTLEIPLNFQYKFGMPGGNRFFVGIGPYIAYNLGGKIKESGQPDYTLKIGSTKPDGMGNDGDDLKALDLGAGINAGYALKMGLFFRAHYQMGFLNLIPGGDSNTYTRTSALGISVGYNIGGHHHTKKDMAK